VADVFVEGIRDPFPQGPGTRCYRLYRVCCWEGLVSQDGLDSVYRFDAPDTESVRKALRSSGFSYRRAWPGVIYRGPDAVVPDQALVLAAPAWQEPADTAPSCGDRFKALHSIGGDLAMAYVSLDWKRLIAFCWSGGRRFTGPLPDEFMGWSIEESWPLRD